VPFAVAVRRVWLFFMSHSRACHFERAKRVEKSRRANGRAATTAVFLDFARFAGFARNDRRWHASIRGHTPFAPLSETGVDKFGVGGYISAVQLRG
jgi:hypothetical protein